MDIEILIEDFIKVCEIAQINLVKSDIQTIILDPGEKHLPSPLPKQHMAVYIFVDKSGQCLKVGKVGKNSNARYQSQHYNADSSRSNLAKSILNDYDLNNEIEIQNNVGLWIKQNTKRINLILNYDKGIFTLNLLEAFVQNRLKPKYEGYDSQK